MILNVSVIVVASVVRSPLASEKRRLVLRVVCQNVKYESRDRALLVRVMVGNQLSAVLLKYIMARTIRKTERRNTITRTVNVMMWKV